MTDQATDTAKETNGSGSFYFDRKIDVGNAFTALTIAGGLIWFLVLRAKELKAARRKRIESGGMRVILKLLREHGGPIHVTELYERYSSDSLIATRKTYCGSNYVFTKDEFDQALYGLDIERTMVFVGEDEVMFRYDLFAKSEYERANSMKAIKT